MIDKESLTAKVKEIALANGADVCGVPKPDRNWSALVVGCVIPENIDNKATFKHLRKYRDIADKCDKSLKAVKEYLEKEGYTSEIRSAMVSGLSYFTGDYIELAMLAGLGDVGYNQLLVNPKYGSNLMLAMLMTEAELIPATGRLSGCIRCGKCIDACPGNAIRDDGINKLFCLPYSLRGCRKCVIACPVGKD